MNALGVCLAVLGALALVGFVVASLWTHTFAIVAFLAILLTISVGFNMITMSDR